MIKRQKNVSKKAKPVIALICEGRNETEKKFFNNFKRRDSNYILKVYGCESTDIISMAEKACYIYRDNDMSYDYGDKIFCLIDLDLSGKQFLTYKKAVEKYNEIKFVVSNPCFEVWLLFYFTDNPSVERSSKAVKEQLRRYIPDYQEKMDVYKKYELHEKHQIAIQRSRQKKTLMIDTKKLIDKNPYTDVDDLVNYLIEKSFEV